ncbi:MAG: hypothetical protein JEZ08_21710 [Clostridiales bacterium]|nr:hypothetical protein [Clostridiales bacterium]
MTDRKGNISVEALISVTLFILFMSFLFQMLSMFSREDKMSQIVFDGIYTLENYGYLYEKIGVLDQEIDMDLSGHQEIVQFINRSIKIIKQESKIEYLKGVLEQELDAHDITLKSFDIHEDILSCEVTYKREFLFGLSSVFDITVRKRMWLFGDEKELYPNKTLTDVFKKQLEDERFHFVFQTKTGGKYHQVGCFYLVRSTTDQTEIKRISLYDAKYVYHLMPCKRCMKEEIWKSVNE